MRDHGMTLATSVARGDSPGILHQVTRAGQAAAIWTRQREAGLAEWIDGVAAVSYTHLTLPTTPYV